MHEAMAIRIVRSRALRSTLRTKRGSARPDTFFRYVEVVVQVRVIQSAHVQSSYADVRQDATRFRMFSEYRGGAASMRPSVRAPLSVLCSLQENQLERGIINIQTISTLPLHVQIPITAGFWITASDLLISRLQTVSGRTTAKSRTGPRVPGVRRLGIHVLRRMLNGKKTHAFHTQQSMGIINLLSSGG